MKLEESERRCRHLDLNRAEAEARANFLSHTCRAQVDAIHSLEETNRLMLISIKKRSVVEDSLRDQLARKDEVIAAKDAEIAAKEAQLALSFRRSASEDALRKQLGEKAAELTAMEGRLAEVEAQLARQTAAIREVVAEVGRCPACWEHMGALMVTGCGHTFCQRFMDRCEGHPCPVCCTLITDTVQNYSIYIYSVILFS
ncbi:unnamed protein product [Caenorhabditis brenneri]